MPFYKKNKTDISRSRRLEQSTYKNGLRHIIFSPKGSSYRGEWKDDKENGKGVYKCSEGKNLIYEGDFKDGLFHGFGVMSYKIPKRAKLNPNENLSADDYRTVRVYRGEFRNGKKYGDGLRIYKDGTYYLGEWKNGKRHGFGQVWYADGSWFVGNWVNGSKEGLGICVKKNGNRFEGNFSAGKRHGKGKFYFLSCGQVQEGIWHEDICTIATIKNVQFRQAALWPTKYPLPKITLIDPDKVIKLGEEKALKNQISCEFVDLTPSVVLVKKLSVTIGE